MARIFDVIEYPNEMKDEIVHRFPEGSGAADYRIGSQVIVRESQGVVFFRDGRRWMYSGRTSHHRDRKHSPVDKLQGVQRPHLFPAEVYFVSMKEFANRSGARRSRSSSATRAWDWAWRCCKASAPIPSRSATRNNL